MINNELASDKRKEKSSKRISILFLTFNPNLQGPIPKLAPVLIAEMEALGCQVFRSSWGRHLDHETLLQKLFGRFVDICIIAIKLFKIKPDILYIDTTLNEIALIRDFPLLIVANWFPVKKVVKIHGTKTALLIEPRQSLYKLLARFIIRRSDAILLLADDWMQTWKNFEPKGKYYRVENPFIPINLFRPKSDPITIKNKNLPPSLLFVGRLIKEKGIYELLAAMIDIVKQIDCHLLIAGDGEEKGEIIRLIKYAKLENSISLLGYLPSEKLYTAYQESTIFILPSYREGFPTVIIEAMNFGLPIITTPVGGNPDHLQDGINVLFVKPKDPKSIVNAVVQLLNDPKLCLEMRDANLAKAQEFKPENVVFRYVEIFSELLER